MLQNYKFFIKAFKRCETFLYFAPLKQKYMNLSLEKVALLARGTLFKRFIIAPHRYIYAQCIHKLWFPLMRRGVSAQAKTFFNAPLSMVLPSATDIYLTGGKTHDSEIRLAEFIINFFNDENSVNPSQTRDFIDVGAHIGYFSTLVGHLLGVNGKIIAVEAACGTFELLSKNTVNFKNITAIHAAATANEGEKLTFYEFPVLYSEYNSTDISHYENATFFKKFTPQKVEVLGVTLDNIIEKFNLINPLIKIDAEGGEAAVVEGLQKNLKGQSPTIIIEYLRDSSEAHQEAYNKLILAGFKAFSIEKQGVLQPLHAPNAYFERVGLDSDNFVFKK